MIADNIFRISLLISLSIHVLALSPWHGLDILKKDKNINNKIEVTYLMPKEIEKEVFNIPEKYDLKKDILKISQKDLEEHILTEGKGDNIAMSQDVSKNLEEYIQYYELIRERIKKIVSDKYKYLKAGGEIRLVFTVSSDGSLMNVNYIPNKSSDDKYLIDTALKSVKDASPFPAFPSSLDKDNLTFNLAVLFKNEI